MRNKIIYGLGVMTVAFGSMLCSCGDFDPEGFEALPELPVAEDVKAEVSGHTINVSWRLPAREDITGVQFIRNADTRNPIELGPDATSYEVKGQPMGEEGLFTVKICYSDRYVSEGVTATATLPMETLPGVTSLESTVSGRTVTLSWALPSGSGITGVRVCREGEAPIDLPAGTLSYEMKAQPMGVDLTYSVQVVYDEYYPSEAVTTTVKVPYIAAKMAYLLTVPDWRDLPDDDERAAAEWFSRQENAEFIQPSRIASLDVDLYPVIWIEIDRNGLPLGWENLPSEISGEQTISALRNYTAAGGNLYLANMATQLTVPLGIVPADMPPTVYGNGDGGWGDDVWVINPYLGWDFRDGGDQGFYDRTAHAIYKGLTFEDPNGYGYENLPLIGPGQREDHNCLWDCNIYGRGSYPDVIANFEATTGSLVLATWGHVRDHCVAGLVEFYANANHGRCIANGLAAYEWNQNSGVNPYQHNIEQLTKNILDYLK